MNSIEDPERARKIRGRRWVWSERGLLSLVDLLDVLLARCTEVDEGKRAGILDRAGESPMSA